MTAYTVRLSLIEHGREKDTAEIETNSFPIADAAFVALKSGLDSIGAVAASLSASLEPNE
jgi:hypothetical protein